MLSVKRYLNIPELRQHRFVNIACKAMQSAIGGEYAKRERRPVEVSMNSVVPGTDDLTFEDVLADQQRTFLEAVHPDGMGGT